MAEIGFGYGSEYQLLRALGHHRNSFLKQIQSAIGTSEPIEWLDYPCDRNRLSLDGEYTDIECFQQEPCYDTLSKNWPKFWPVRGSRAQNWDGIFRIGNKWYFVEAKAHLSELESSHRAISEKSESTILNSLDKTAKWLNSSKTGLEWLHSPYYQFANRLAFCRFLRENGIEAYVVNVFFLNGYEKPKGTRRVIAQNYSVTDSSDWQAAINTEIDDLGISEESLRDISYNVIVDCLNYEIAVHF